MENTGWRKELYIKYPILFAQHSLPETETCMCWGICCGDGWRTIIEDACQKISEVNKEYPLLRVEFSQVKEKFGGLRLYFEIKKPAYDYTGTLGAETKALVYKVSEIVKIAEDLSYITCDVCGKPGKESGTSWISTRCDEHRSK